MSAVVLDSGALIAAQRRDRQALALLRSAIDGGLRLRTHAMIVGQVWRGGSGRQAGLARFLASVDVIPIDESMGRAAGELCGTAGTDDPVAAALVLVAEPGDLILTGDQADIELLVTTGTRPVRVVAV